MVPVVFVKKEKGCSLVKTLEVFCICTNGIVVYKWLDYKFLHTRAKQ